jgi:hypothetical protein
MNLELITWIDAESESNDWMPMEKAMSYAKESLPTVDSIGYVLYENEESVSLVHSIVRQKGNESVTHAIKIPKGMIKMRKTIDSGVNTLQDNEKKKKSVER